MINTFRNACSTSPIPQIRYPTTISPTKLLILTQQITADFQLSQEALNHLSNQMNDMVKTNKLLKKVVQGTYKTLTDVQKENPRNVSNRKKTISKTQKVVTFVKKIKITKIITYHIKRNQILLTIRKVQPLK